MAGCCQFPWINDLSLSLHYTALLREAEFPKMEFDRQRDAGYARCLAADILTHEISSFLHCGALTFAAFLPGKPGRDPAHARIRIGSLDRISQKRLSCSDSSAALSILLIQFRFVRLDLGRLRTTDMREVLNAVFYTTRTGCAWRMLPPRLCGVALGV